MGPRGGQAVTILTAFGNGNATAGSKTDAFLPREELCFGIPPLPPLLSSLLRCGRSGTAFGRNWGGCFQNAPGSRVARHCFERVWAEACCVSGRELGADTTNLLRGRRDKTAD